MVRQEGRRRMSSAVGGGVRSNWLIRNCFAHIRSNHLTSSGARTSPSYPQPQNLSFGSTILVPPAHVFRKRHNIISSLLYNIALVALLACRKARYPQRVNIDRLCPPQHHFFGNQASYSWRLLYSVP